MHEEKNFALSAELQSFKTRNIKAGDSFEQERTKMKSEMLEANSALQKLKETSEQKAEATLKKLQQQEEITAKLKAELEASSAKQSHQALTFNTERAALQAEKEDLNKVIHRLQEEAAINSRLQSSMEYTEQESSRLSAMLKEKVIFQIA